MKVLAVALTVALVTAGCHGEKTLARLRNMYWRLAKRSTSELFRFRASMSSSGMDGSPIRIVVDTGAMDGYADPARPREYRLPISRFVQVK